VNLPVLGEAGDWDTDTFNLLCDVADRVARNVRSQYHTVSEEDLGQEALMWAVTHPGPLENYLLCEDEKQRDRLLYSAMRNHCRQYARKTRAGQFDLDLTDDVWYKLEALKGRGSRGRGLLHMVYDDEAWLTPENEGGESGRKPASDPAEGNGWLATLADVSRAVELIGPAERWLIEKHYRDGWTYKEVGLSLFPAVGHETVSKRMDRAVRKIQEILGGSKPREDPPEPGWADQLVGTRRAISNSRARHLTDASYE